MVIQMDYFPQKETSVSNNSYNASVGATALKLEDQFESITEPQKSFETEQQTAVQSETSLNLK